MTNKPPFQWTKIETKNLIWFGVDFDDTICSNTGYPDFIPGLPFPDTVETLQKIAKMGYKITIITARPSSDYQNIERYCEYYDIPVRRIFCGSKPLLAHYVDDKNIAFNPSKPKESWLNVIETIKSKNLQI